MSPVRRIERRIASALLRASRLPSVEAVEPGSEERARFEAAAERLLEAGERSADVPLVALLCWVAATRGLLFHGSDRGDLDRLEPIRLSRDASPFGDQQAVFASSDPVWAIYFATLRRGDGLRSTRNVSYGLADALFPRRYYFSHNAGAAHGRRFGAGTLYVLPREPFRREPLLWDILDPGQWASPTPVEPLAVVPVTAADFPFADRVFPHRVKEPVFVTALRASAREWRR
jgi:hypothetical protein